MSIPSFPVANTRPCEPRRARPLKTNSEIGRHRLFSAVGRSPQSDVRFCAGVKWSDGPASDMAMLTRHPEATSTSLWHDGLLILAGPHSKTEITDRRGRRPALAPASRRKVTEPQRRNCKRKGMFSGAPAARPGSRKVSCAPVVIPSLRR
jgi:hypothetical protein